MTTTSALYRQLADALRAQIAAGRYAVGAQLPTEHELCAEHGVSRHTAREALRLLEEDGLIIRRRGAGTIVTQPRQPLFSQTLGDLNDLLQYARAARLEVKMVETAPEMGVEARGLDLPNGYNWARIEGLRRRDADKAPIALTHIFVRADLCPPAVEIRAWPGALNELIAQKYNVQAVRIEQEIAAVALRRVEARALDAELGAPALKTIRRYCDAAGEPFQVSVSLHPGDRFVYAMSLDRA